MSTTRQSQPVPKQTSSGITRTIRAIGAALVLIALSYAATGVARLPSPPALIGLALDWQPPSRSWEYFDGAPLAAAAVPAVFEERKIALAPEVAWRDGGRIDFAGFLRETHTNALLVVQHGRLVYEHYPLGAQRATVFPSYSVAKSMLSDLVGVALAEGKITALSDPVRKYVPDLPEKFATLTVDDLLNMRSGVRVEEKYDSAFSQIAFMYITTDLKRFVRGLDQTAFTPGQGFTYRSVDYLLLGMVLSAATGEPVTRYLERKLWQPMGAAYGASWSVDNKKHGVEKSFCCVNARAVDFARYGLLHLRQGRAGGVQVLPAAWMQRPPEVGTADADFAYGRGWWLPRQSVARDGGSAPTDYTAIGIHGQYVYIDPVSDTVIVKLSDHGNEQDEALTVAAFRSIVAALPLGD